MIVIDNEEGAEQIAVAIVGEYDDEKIVEIMVELYFMLDTNQRSKIKKQTS